MNYRITDKQRAEKLYSAFADMAGTPHISDDPYHDIDSLTFMMADFISDIGYPEINELVKAIYNRDKP